MNIYRLNILSTNKSLATVQNRISTGMKVAEASDNAAYWSIATTMRGDNSANEAVLSSLGVGAAKIDNAYTAAKEAIDKVQKISEHLVTAKNGTAADRAKLQEEISTLQSQLAANAKAAIAGTALLSSDSSKAGEKFQITSAFNRASDGTVTIYTIDLDLKNVRLVDTIKSADTTPVEKKGIFDTQFEHDTGWNAGASFTLN